MKIYLDVCALHRLLDDQKQPRIRREAEAVEEIFRLIQAKSVQWIAGAVLEAEIARNPDPQKKEDARALLRFADQQPKVSTPILTRAIFLERTGYGAFDALHLAMAEGAGASVLLTTDDRFIRQVKRGLGNPAIPVMNPLNWLQRRKP
jgi:predicted nucleic acid-binding protein